MYKCCSVSPHHLKGMNSTFTLNNPRFSHRNTYMYVPTYVYIVLFTIGTYLDVKVNKLKEVRSTCALKRNSEYIRTFTNYINHKSYKSSMQW